ncbi:MAG: DNA primase [Candidatus Izemoplasmataceae bacterium]
MPNINDSIVDEILYKTNIVDLISEVTPLEKKGKNHFGLCPFHHEKTPSFSVDEEKGLYHCFSCKASGNAITFVKETKNISSQQAIEYLASRLNIDYAPKQSSNPLRKYYEINQEANQFFKIVLNHTSLGKEALAYLKARGLKKETIETFDIGLAPNQKDALYQALIQKSFLSSDCMDLGLIKEDQTVYDMFRNRIMFPLHNEEGDVVGFSGRIYQDDTSMAKYMNSPQSVIFEKSDVLYNLNRIKPFVKEKNRIVIFEGFMDVISAYQAGIKEGVAVMGTALTDKHIQKLKKYTNTIILCFDGDQAGIDATHKFIRDLKRAKFEVKVAMLEEKLDPDDTIKTYGNAHFVKLIDEALDATNYLYESYKQHVSKNQITEIEQFKKRIFEMIKDESSVVTDYYLRKLSKDFSISQEILQQDFSSIKKTYTPTYKKLPKVDITDKFIKAERGLIYYFFKDRYYERRFRSEFKDIMFNDKHARDIQLEIFEYYRLNKESLCIVPALFMHYLSEDKQAYFKRYIEQKNYPHDEQEFEDYLKVMREQNRRSEITILKQKLKAAMTTEEKIHFRKEIDAIIKEANHGKRKNYSGTH